MQGKAKLLYWESSEPAGGTLGLIGDCVGSVGHDKGSLGSLSCAYDHSGAPSGCRVLPGSRGFTHTCLDVIGFIRARVCSLRRT